MLQILSLVLMVATTTQPPGDDLSRIINAQAQHDFVGTWVREFRHADTTVVVVRRIWHRHPDQTRIEFLEPEELRNSTLFIRGEMMRFIGNRHRRHFVRTGRMEAPMFVELFRNMRELDWVRENYDIIARKGEVLLGRDTDHLSFVAKHAHRGRLEVWADRQTGILLRNRRFDRKGELVSTSWFREIEYLAVDSATVAIPESLAVHERNRIAIDEFTDLGTFITRATDSVLLPRELPAGFHFRQVKTIHRRGKTYFHLQYSDGLTAVSLFERRREHARKGRQRKAGHALKSRGEGLAIVEGEMEGIAFDLIGDIAPEELETMAAGMVLVKKEELANRSIPTWLWATVIALVFLSILWWLSRRQLRKTRL